MWETTHSIHEVPAPPSPRRPLRLREQADELSDHVDKAHSWLVRVRPAGSYVRIGGAAPPPHIVTVMASAVG